MRRSEGRERGSEHQEVLDALSAQFFINKYHLLREFKSYAQVTLYQYILQKRITHAKNLLRSDTPPALVCTQCGFKDYSGFYKAFNKQTSLSLRQYVGLTQLMPNYMSVGENDAEM